jgi:hypothetical protein
MNTTIKSYDFQEAQSLMNTQEILSQEERDVCMQLLPGMAKKYLFHNAWNNTYLNLYVYSEVEKDQHDLLMEQGL